MIADSSEYPLKDGCKIEREALRLGWNIPDEYKDKIIERQVKIAIDPKATPRESSVAARVIVSANAQNVQLAMSPTVQDDSDRLAPVDTSALLMEMRRRTAPDAD